jgi:hypothetical protein
MDQEEANQILVKALGVDARITFDCSCKRPKIKSAKQTQLPHISLLDNLHPNKVRHAFFICP